MAQQPHAAAASEHEAAAGEAVEHGVAHPAGAPAAAGAHGAAAEHKTEGLPQFDTTQWAGQAAWFLILFAIILLLMRFVFVPRIGGTIEAREAKISGDIDEARRMKDEADLLAEQAAAETAKARAEAQKLAAEARAKAQAEIAARMATEEAKIAETMAKAEADIATAREASMANVRTIAVETAQAIVQKLTGRAASAAEVNAATAGRA